MAVLIVTLLNESNHFSRRFRNQGKIVEKARTKNNFFINTEINDNFNEGGRFMSQKIFKNEIIDKLNIHQVLYILNFKNWDHKVTIFADKFKTLGALKDKIVDFDDSLKDLLKKLKIEFSDFKDECDEFNSTDQYVSMTSRKNKELSMKVGYHCSVYN